MPRTLFPFCAKAQGSIERRKQYQGNLEMVRDRAKRAVACLTLLSCIVSFCGCGYFLYPERRGQTTGEIDLPVLILDCVGLFFFIIPGVAALAVDFSSGAVYLPNKKNRASLDVIRLDKAHVHDRSYLESLIAKHTGGDVRLTGKSVKRLRMGQKSEDSIVEMLEYLNSHIDDNSILDRFEGVPIVSQALVR